MFFKEDYIGKTKILIEAEKELNKVVPKLEGDYTYNKVKPLLDLPIADIKKALDKVSKAFCKQFGFKSCTINISAADATINAYTICNNTDIENMELNRSASGYNIKKNSKFEVYITVNGPFFNGLFTAGEIMAVLLHEVGHHFGCKAMLYDLSNIKRLTNFIKGLSEINKTLGIVKKSSTHKDNSVNIFKLLKMSKDGLYSFKVLGNTYNYILGNIDINKMIDSNAKIGKIIDDITVKEINYKLYDNEEVMADSFAAVYGYGPELSSCVSKLEDIITPASTMARLFGTEADIINGKGIGIVTPIVYYLTELLFYIPIGITAGILCFIGLAPELQHQSSRRVVNIINALRMELENNNIPDKQRNQIIKDLNKLEKEYVDYMNTRDKILIASGGLTNFIFIDGFNHLIYWAMQKGIINPNPKAYKSLQRLIEKGEKNNEK